MSCIAYVQVHTVLGICPHYCHLHSMQMPALLSFTTAHLLCCGFTIMCLWPMIHCLLQFLSEATVAYTMTYKKFELCMQVKSAGL